MKELQENMGIKSGSRARRILVRVMVGIVVLAMSGSGWVMWQREKRVSEFRERL